MGFAISLDAFRWALNQYQKNPQVRDRAVKALDRTFMQ